MIEANYDEVICPNCVTQFRAIPVNVQTRIAELEAAAKLALDALEMAQNNLASSRAMLGGYTAAWDKYADAIAALKKVGA
jgi:hypothetical protein